MYGTGLAVIVAMMLAACGTAATPGTDASPDLSDMGCVDGTKDLSFDNCYCAGNPVPGFPVCTGGKFACPTCPLPDGSSQELPDAFPDASLPDGWQCNPANFDSSDDNCQCWGGAFLNHVCMAGKIVCPAPCSDGSPDTGPDTSGTDATSDTSAAPYSAVQAIFDARCINCHSATALGLPGYAKLPLTSDVSYQNLVNKPSNETCGNLLVAPGKPKESYLWQKVTQDAPCEGSHMPAKFEVLPAPPLTTEQLAAIQDWIAGGAQP